MATMEKCLYALELRSELQLCGQCPKLSSVTASSLGKGLATFPNLSVKVPLLPGSPPQDPVLPPPTSHLCQPLHLTPHHRGVPAEQVPSRSKSQESGHVGFVRKLPAAGPLIYLPRLSLPSVFILLSAQDKWLPYSAELQRSQSS